MSEESLDEENFYNIKNLEEYMEDDETNPEEEGFMLGYLK